MHKTMVFIDYENFNINLHQHYEGKAFKNVNYKKLSEEINSIIPFTSEVMKTYLFAYKPCELLMQLDIYKRYYSWLESLKNISYLDVVEGRLEIKYIEGVEFDINNTNTYIKEEKETDINLATHMVAKGFQNAYDIAVLVSGDTDYVNIIKTLHDLGKIIVIAIFPHQNISKYNGMYDSHIILYDDLIERATHRKIQE